MPKKNPPESFDSLLRKARIYQSYDLEFEIFLEDVGDSETAHFAWKVGAIMTWGVK